MNIVIKGINFEDLNNNILTIEEVVPIVRCKDCKHRPVDTSGHNYGPDLLFPNDYKCPCKCADPYYSWMPKDDWFCANGKRRDDD